MLLGRATGGRQSPGSRLPAALGGLMLGGRERKEGTQLERDGQWDHALGQRPLADPQGRCGALSPGSVPGSFSLRAIGAWDQAGEASTWLSHSGHSSSSWSGAEAAAVLGAQGQADILMQVGTLHLPHRWPGSR